MTFIIKTDVTPTVTNLPKFEFIKTDLKTILTKGSLCLVTADELQVFGGKSMRNLIVGLNLAESLFRENYAADVNVNIWSSASSDNDIDTYVQMTAVENGLKFTTSGNPATAKLGLLKFMSEENMRAVLTTAKDIYFDVWITPLQYPTMVGNTSKPWTECSIAKISMDSSPTQNSNVRITANYVNLQTTDTKWYTKSDTTLGQQYTDGSYVLNEPKFMAASQTLEAYNQANKVNATIVGQIHASVLEGGYMSQDFILHSIYAEDLTKSGRTANEVAAIRKKHFDRFFS
ncbi:hypothetical protein [Acinetobacter lwoffii]|uniref:hypothetical protein n=1 Tax=Acinetobacter lwoffii TaxID=28090 RepID=UPI00168D034D|nr:hypothetical protein [Acinetobacter lwoffii]